MNGIWILFLFFLLVFVALFARASRTTVFEYERGLKFTRGRLKGVVGPGLYWHFASFTRIDRIDVRPARVAVSGRRC